MGLAYTFRLATTNVVSVFSVKTMGTIRIIRLDELSSFLRLLRRGTEYGLCRRIMSLVYRYSKKVVLQEPQALNSKRERDNGSCLFRASGRTEYNNKCLAKFVQKRNAYVKRPDIWKEEN